MGRIRVQKPKKIRKRATSPLEEITGTSSSRSRLLRGLEEMLEDIDRALEATAALTRSSSAT